EIPLIVSTTLDDASLFFDNFSLDEAALRQWLEARYGEAADGIYRLYRARWPAKTPFLLQAQIVTDSGFRRFACTHAERKAAQQRAAVYCYRWDWVSPALDGLYGAAHASDVPASLGNCREALLGGAVGAANELNEALTSAWVAFARHGDPNNPRTPRWPAFIQQSRSTLILAERSRIENDPD